MGSPSRILLKEWWQVEFQNYKKKNLWKPLALMLSKGPSESCAVLFQVSLLCTVQGCSPQASGINGTWECVRNSNSIAPSQTNTILSCRGGGLALRFPQSSFAVVLTCTQGCAPLLQTFCGVRTLAFTHILTTTMNYYNYNIMHCLAWMWYALIKVLL